jgi:hypothetical protein
MCHFDIDGVVVATGGDPGMKLGLPVIDVARRALGLPHRAPAGSIRQRATRRAPGGGGDDGLSAADPCSRRLIVLPAVDSLALVVL